MNNDTVKFLEMALAAAKVGQVVGIGAIVITTNGALQFHYSGSQKAGPFLTAGGAKIEALGLADSFPDKKQQSSLVMARPPGLPS